jgi:hypothetical protein
MHLGVVRIRIVEEDPVLADERDQKRVPLHGYTFGNSTYQYHKEQSHLQRQPVTRQHFLPIAALYTLCDLMQSILYLLPLTSLISLSLSCVQSGLLHLPMVRGEVISVLGEALEVCVLSIL